MVSLFSLAIVYYYTLKLITISYCVNLQVSRAMGQNRILAMLHISFCNFISDDLVLIKKIKV